MAKLKLAQVGCGGMGLRHMYGQVELRQQGFDTFDVVAVCDIQRAAAEHVAGVAEKALGRRPRVYTNYDEMLEKERGLDTIDIVTDERFHHTLAIKAFEAGLHVATEKPMALTVRACRKMIEAATRKKRMLSVSENYRRDPMNRLVKALIESNAIGDPRLMMYVATSGSRMVQQVAAWRHLKQRGGLLLEYIVHESDLFLYFLGDVERIYTETHLWEKVRHTTDKPLSGNLARFYGHRVKEDLDKSEIVECTSEDMALAVIRFRSGAMGQLTFSMAAPGEPTHVGVVYCGDGSIKLPGSRSGNPVRVTKIGAQEPVPIEEVLDLVPNFHLDETTSRFFNGQKRLSSYKLTFEEIDRKLIAVELQDFADAVLTGGQPEVTGEVGLKAVALTYAFLESGLVNKPVSLKDVAEDRVNAYQREINESIGL